MTVADTDVLIDFLKGRGEADAVERLLRLGTIRTTVISRFELLSGAKTPKEQARLIHLLDAIPSLALDAAAADQASEVRKSLERSGAPIGMADSLIAGIVLRAGATLLTRNRRHFSRVPGLMLS